MIGFLLVLFIGTMVVVAFGRRRRFKDRRAGLDMSRPQQVVIRENTQGQGPEHGRRGSAGNL